MRKVSRWLVGFAALTLIAAACGDDAGEPGAGDDVKTYDSIGEGEGQLKLIAWHGYTEDGTTEGYEEYDWVTPFEDDTGCDVEVTYADSSDEMVQLMRQGGGAEYDGVSASGDASNRLIAGGDVGAVDPSLFPEMENVIAPINPDGGTNTDSLHRRGQRVRNPVHVRPELPHVQHRGGQPGAHELGRDVRDRLPVRGQGDGVRFADLHR